MADHAPAVAAAHADAHAGEHPSYFGYVKVFFVLLLLTACEVGALYVPALHGILPFLLIGLSALKFGIVAAFYMHLKFDSKLFTVMFAGGLALAISVGLAFATLFGTWWQVPVTRGGSEIEHGSSQPPYSP